VLRKTWDADVVFGLLASSVPWVMTLSEESHLTGFRLALAKAMLKVGV